MLVVIIDKIINLLYHIYKSKSIFWKKKNRVVSRIVYANLKIFVKFTTLFYTYSIVYSYLNYKQFLEF